MLFPYHASVRFHHFLLIPLWHGIRFLSLFTIIGGLMITDCDLCFVQEIEREFTNKSRQQERGKERWRKSDVALDEGKKQGRWIHDQVNWMKETEQSDRLESDEWSVQINGTKAGREQERTAAEQSITHDDDEEAFRNCCRSSAVMEPRRFRYSRAVRPRLLSPLQLTITSSSFFFLLIFLGGDPAAEAGEEGGREGRERKGMRNGQMKKRKGKREKMEGRDRCTRRQWRRKRQEGLIQKAEKEREGEKKTRKKSNWWLSLIFCLVSAVIFTFVWMSMKTNRRKFHHQDSHLCWPNVRTYTKSRREQNQ